MIKYKLFNYLFGWDYIYWWNGADQGIRRVHVDALGKPFYVRYQNTQVLDFIEKRDQVKWLTCIPKKYDVF